MLPIFYINLDKRHDRNLQLKNQLNNLKLDAQRISAIDGSKLTLLEREFVNEHNFLLTMKRPIRDGEIGCAASHRSIWQQIVDNDLNYALVLEDDAVIDKKILTLLNHSQFYQQFDLINLSSNLPYNPNDETIKTLLQDENSVKRSKMNQQIWQQLDWRGKWKIYELDRLSDDIIVCTCSLSPALTSGYLVSKKAAQNFLLASSNMHYPIDYVWRYCGGYLKLGFLSKPLIVQADEVVSDISGRDEIYQLSMKQKLQRMLLKHRKNIRSEQIKQMYDV